MADSKISALPASTVPLGGTEVLPIVQSSATKQVTVADLTAGRAVSAISITTNGVSRLTGGIDANAPLLIDKAGTTNGRMRLFVGDGTSGTLADENYIGNLNTDLHIRSTTTDTFVFSVAGNLSPKIAAKGINFTANTPAAGMTSQLLNWYEEGTWTPTITGGTTAGTASYATQTGAYTKVGRQVTVTCRLTWSAANGTGVMQISGLPFTTTGITNQVAQIMPISLAVGDITYVMGYVAGSVTKVQLYKYAAGTASTISVEASGDLIMTMTYTAS